MKYIAFAIAVTATAFLMSMPFLMPVLPTPSEESLRPGLFGR